MTTLCVAAHPDDEILGCGGTLARLTGEGEVVFIAVLGEGVTSRAASRGDADTEALRALKDDCRRAAERVGAKDLFLFDLPDNSFDTVPMLEVVKLVEGVVADVQPDRIFTHHPGDLNVDHGIVHRAVLTATRPMDADAVRQIYAFEVPSSTDWAFERSTPFRPNAFFDIATTIDVKVAAMEEYRSERKAFPHPRSPEALRATATRWGSVIGCESAEAFELVRGIY